MINKNLDKNRHTKVLLGLQVIIINLSKFIIIFTIAGVLNAFIESVVVFISFAFLRQVIGGLHTKTSLGCSFFSSILIIGTAILGSNIKINNINTILILIINTILILKYVPGDTCKNPIVDIKKIKSLKIESLKRLLIQSIIIIITTNYNISDLVLLGCTLAIILTLPIVYELFSQKRPIDKLIYK